MSIKIDILVVENIFYSDNLPTALVRLISRLRVFIISITYLNLYYGPYIFTNLFNLTEELVSQALFFR